MKKKELFIVEGKSAGSTIEQAIDKKSQSVYAIQGKLANVSKMSRSAVAENLECQQLYATLGGDFPAEYLIKYLPYSRVLVLMDPDIDGSHSRALLLSFFARYCKPIVAQGLLSVIKAPMFKLSANDREPMYIWGEDELQQVLSKNADQPLRTTRYKGIAQFSTDECHQFMLNPETRRQAVLSLS